MDQLITKILEHEKSNPNRDYSELLYELSKHYTDFKHESDNRIKTEFSKKQRFPHYLSPQTAAE